jgi:hypothetical protein
MANAEPGQGCHFPITPFSNNNVRNNGSATMATTSGEANKSDLAWLFQGPSGPSKADVRRWWQQRR